MVRKLALVVLALPLAAALVGCAQTGRETSANGLQTAQAILGVAIQVLGAINGQTQPIGGSLAANLPGAPATTGTVPAGQGQGAPAPQTLPAPTGGSSAQNALALANAAAQPGLGKSNDGRLNLSQYGGPSDRTPDANTRAGLGNRNNRLRLTSIALSPNLIREYGLRGGEAIYITTAAGTMFLGHYDDTTGNRAENNVIDVYDPTDSLGRDSFLKAIPAGRWSLSVGPQNA